MNEKHSLDAPDNESLQTVRQLGDHSELSGLYREAKKGWDGTIMSEEDRQKKRDEQLNAFSLSIRKKSVLIGLLIPTPLLISAFLVAFLYEYIFPLNTGDREALNIVPSIIVGALCLAISYAILKKIYGTFYEHTLRLGPFLMVMWTLLGISAQALYLATLPLHNARPVIAVLYIGVATLLWSTALSATLLTIWTSSRISSRAKLNYIVLIALLVVVVTGALSVANIL